MPSSTAQSSSGIELSEPSSASNLLPGKDVDGEQALPAKPASVAFSESAEEGEDESKDQEPRPSRGRKSVIVRARLRQKESTLRELNRTGSSRVAPRKHATKVKALLDHRATSLALSTALVLSLFFADTWVIINPPTSADVAINSILMVVVLLFVFEIAANLYCRPAYNIRTGVFWMDVLGTLSVLIDISWIINLDSASGNATAVRAARVAKLGTKTSRLARLVKMFKYLYNGDGEDESGGLIVSRRLNRMVAQGVAFLTLFVVVVNPLFNVDLSDQSYYSMTKTLDFFVDHQGVDPAYNLTADQWYELVDNYRTLYRKVENRDADNLVGDPVWVKVNDLGASRCPTSYSEVSYDASKRQCFWDWKSSGTIRDDNTRTFSSGVVEVEYDVTRIVIEESIKSICLVLFVIFILCAFTGAFSSAVESLVVKPISRIITRLKESTSSILASMSELMGDNQIDKEHPLTDDELNDAVSETDLLEIIIAKLTRVVNNAVDQKIHTGETEVDSQTSLWLSTQYSQEYQSFARARHSFLPKTRSSMALSGLPCDIDTILSFNFDTLRYSHDELVPCVLFMYKHYKLLDCFKIEETKLINFIEGVRAGYRKDPQYHNWWHGVDVCHTVFRLIASTHAHSFLSQLEIFASLTSALGHDLGHLGVNNSFLVKTKHMLALQYNDASPLENMHCATLYEVLAQPECDITNSFSSDEWSAARAQIIKCILNTDMVLHAKNLATLQTFYEVNGSEFTDFIVSLMDLGMNAHPELPPCLQEAENRLMIQETFLHCADLSNPVHPLQTYQKWVVRVTDEFFSQGDKEKELGMPPSPMCDRDNTNIPSMQVNFIDFVIAPLYTTVFQLFLTSLIELADNLKANHAHYIDVRVNELAANDPEAAKMLARKAAMTKKLGFLYGEPQDPGAVV